MPETIQQAFAETIFFIASIVSIDAGLLPLRPGHTAAISVLSALAVAEELLTEEQLAGIVGIAQTAARRILMELRPVLESGASASRISWYGLFTNRSATFCSTCSSGAFRVVPIEAHGLLADYFFHAPTARAYDGKPLVGEHEDPDRAGAFAPSSHATGLGRRHSLARISAASVARGFSLEEPADVLLSLQYS